MAISQRLAWHGFAFDLPPGWEVTAYRLDPRRGEFRLHERLRERGQLTWVRMAARPDLVGVAGEILTRQVVSAGQEAIRPTVLTVGDFTVIHAGPGLPFQALAWVAHDTRLLHWTFPEWVADRPDADWRQLLESCSTVARDNREWAIFGLRVFLPHAFRPREIEATPGTVAIEFIRDDGRGVTARRWALAASLLEERPLGEWARRSLLHERSRIDEVATVRRGRMAAVRAVFSIRGERTYDRVLWRRWPGVAWWWHDEAANRICALEQTAPAGLPLLEVDHVWPV